MPARLIGPRAPLPHHFGEPVSCRSGCPTKDCGSYAACLKGMNLQVGDLTGQGDAKTTDKRLSAYATARKAGLQPPTTRLRDSMATLRAAGA